MTDTEIADFLRAARAMTEAEVAEATTERDAERGHLHPTTTTAATTYDAAAH